MRTDPRRGGTSHPFGDLALTKERFCESPTVTAVTQSYFAPGDADQSGTLTDAAELKQCSGWSLHQLRHSALTHEAEDGTNTPTLLARSRYASVRSLERYARPGVDAVADHVASRDPAARRRIR
ncbi:hypothetical protein OG339_19915 [Streptosporangium sp. NBC_01495]|uniref:hypothetical protein n=1 Tax=Streptosporangium sp. NBC_01495 TaxID=2903899 RepID=UPI002E328ADB|nr:hypothetical protein [Streptosporangium sp. NBC_01495]